MLYEKYFKKTLKWAYILSVLKRFRVLIFTGLAILVAALATFFAVFGVVYDDVDCPAAIEYGETLNYQADAIFGSVRYEYSPAGKEEWSSTVPSVPGEYQVRGVSKNAFGEPRYGTVYAFAITQRKVTVSVDKSVQSVVYGANPAVSADLAENDSMVCTKFTYADRSQKSTDITPDVEGVVIYNAAGEDITDYYEISCATAKDIVFAQRDLTIRVEDYSDIYNGQPIGFDTYTVAEETPLAFDDQVALTFSANITNAEDDPVENKPEVVVQGKNGATLLDVTQHYRINVVAGTIDVEPRPLHIQLTSREKVYDGESMAFADFISDADVGYTIIDGSLATGHRISAIDFGDDAITNVGEFSLDGAILTIVDEAGNEIDIDNYALSFTAGTLKVTARPLSVSTGSDSLTYNGEEQSVASISAKTDDSEGANTGLIEGHTLKNSVFPTFSWVNTYTNEATVVVTDSEGNDVTGNYSVIDSAWGSVEITQRAVSYVTQSVATGECVYDGETHVFDTVTDVSEGDNTGLVAGHSFLATMESSFVFVADSGENIIGTLTILDGAGADVTENYLPSGGSGYVEITKRSVSLQSSEEKVYDEIEFIHHGAEDISATTGALGLVSGHTVEVETAHKEYENPYAYIDVGEYANVITGEVIYDAEGGKVTENYEVDRVEGILTIHYRPATLTTGSLGSTDSTSIDAVVYDGDPHFTKSYAFDKQIESRGLLTVHEDKLVLQDWTEITDVRYDEEGKVTSIDNVLKIAVIREDGSDATGNYAVTKEWGTLALVPRPVTFFTDSNTWVYDGVSHTQATFTPSKELPDSGLVKKHGHTGKIVETELASVKNVTKKPVENKMTIAIYDKDGAGVEVTSNYVISYVYGTLSVTPRPVLFTTHSNEFIFDDTDHSFAERGTGYTVEEEGDGRGLLSTHSETVVDFTTVRYAYHFVGNVITWEIFDKFSGEPVTSNYTIEDGGVGTLTVVPRSVWLETYSDSWVYDDTDHDNRGGYTLQSESGNEGLLNSHYSIVTDYTTVRYVADSAKNELTFAIRRLADGSLVGMENYTISYREKGDLTITARPVTLVSSDTKIYNGKIFNCNTVKTHEDSEYDLVGGHTVTATTYHGEYANAYAYIDVGEYDNFIDKESVLIRDNKGEKVTENYEITYETGTLTITPRPLTLSVISASKIYDGVRFDEAYNEFTVGAGTKIAEEEPLVSPHTLTLTIAQPDAGEYAYIDAGTYDLAIDLDSVAIYDGEAKRSVYHNYWIEVIYNGTVTIAQREITLLTGSTKAPHIVYDGKWHSVKEITDVSVGKDAGLVLSHVVSCSFYPEFKDEGKHTNEVLEEDVAIDDPAAYRSVLHNYSITLKFGTVTILPRPITVTTVGADSPILYDGQAHTFEGWEDITYGQTNKGRVPTHTIETSTFTAFVNAGTYENVIKIFIFDEEGEDVTYNYEIKYEYGTVQIIPRTLILNLEGGEFTYDGQTHRFTEYTIGEGCDGLASGHTIDEVKTVWKGFMHAGEYKNDIAGLIIIDADGKQVYTRLDGDVPENYTVTVNAGKVIVHKRVITVETGSMKWEYDGESHSYPYITVGGAGLAVTDEISAKDFATITEVGTLPNTFGVLSIIHVDEGEVLPDYEIAETIYGTLEITGFKLLVTSEKSGELYLRAYSFGDYGFTGENPWINPGYAPIYDELIDGKYNANYLSSLALASEYLPADISIENGAGVYLLPSYTAAVAGDYDIPLSDVINGASGDYSKYSMQAFYYDYEKQGMVPVPAKYAAYERAYAEFVKANYTYVPSETAAFLQEIIDKEGFTVGDHTNVHEVLNYVRGVATYSLDYDRALDSESDVVQAFLSGKYESGLCRHYASSATLLFRQLGIPARYVAGFYATTRAGETVEVLEEQGHAWTEIYIDGMGWVTVDATGLPDVEPEKDVITLKPIDCIKTYDGKPLTYGEKIVYEGLEPTEESAYIWNLLISKGYYYETVISGSQTEVGSSASTVTDFKFIAPDEILDSYEFVFEEGVLTVTESRTLTIYMMENRLTYTGEPLTYGEDEWYYEEVLPEGYTVELDVSIFRLEKPGSLTSLPDGYAIEDICTIWYDDGVSADRVDVTSEFVIAINVNLTMLKKNITVTAGSNEQMYNGKELTCDTHTITGEELIPGHEFIVEIEGSITDIGTRENVVTSVTVIDTATKEDVTEFYDITRKNGTLTVVK